MSDYVATIYQFQKDNNNNDYYYHLFMEYKMYYTHPNQEKM